MSAREPVTASIFIQAPPHTVFPYFTDRDLLITWMGQAARLDPRPGGELAITVDGTSVQGHYRELDPPHRLVFSWGFAGSAELPPASSTVEVDLIPVDGGTRVELVHRDLPAAQRPSHARGWSRFLNRLAQVAPAPAPPRPRSPAATGSPARARPG